MRKLLKINKDKGREVMGMLCKLGNSCWVVAMVVGDQEVFLFLIKPWWMLRKVDDKWIIWFQIKTKKARFKCR
jgi:hypothetical protein